MIQDDSMVHAEILRHDIITFEFFSPEHEAVLFAQEYLNKLGFENMAKRLGEMSQQHLLRFGPVEGFVASAIKLDEKDYIILSNAYPQYMTTAEITASLIHEIGATSWFHEDHHDNEQRALKGLCWVKSRCEQISTHSVINVAVLKKTQHDKEASCQN